MDQSQNLSAFFQQDGSGSGAMPAAPSSGLGSFFSEDANAKTRQISKRQSSSQIPLSVVDDIAQREGLTPTQRTVMGALLGQESDNGANAVTSIDGARGAGQIMPDTFKRYAKDGEDISNQEHNLAVMARIVKDLGTKSGDNPAKIAVGYFSGDGNINSSEGSPWKRDAKDGNGKLVSSYVADVVKRIGNSVISSAQAAPARQDSTQGLPDLNKAPKWADIAANPEYVALSDADKAQAKQEYFNYWIAPHASGERDTLRKQFLTNPDVKKTYPGILERAFSNPADDGSHGDISGESNFSSPLVINVAGTNSSSPAYVPQSNSAPVQSAFGADDFGSIYNVKPDQKENPLWGTGSVMSPNMQGKAQTTPTSPEFTQQVNQAWDAGTPEQRIAMGKRDDAVGQLARARNEQYGLVAPDNKSLDKLDTRAEARGRELVRDGLDTSTVAGASEAQYNAMRGTLPGEELGQASKSDFDFETQKTFNESRFYSNPAVRGAVKGYEGYKQGILGINQFVADKIGADDYSKGFARRGAESRSFTGAMGDPKNYAQSSFENIISSIGQQLPAMIGGALTGSETAVLASMFAQSFGQEYGEGRASGQNQDQATFRAAQYAALEVIGEKFGLKQNMKGWKEITHGNFDKAAKAIASAVKYEVPGEMLTTAGQFLTDKEGYGIGLHTEAGVKEFVQQMVDTVVQTVGQTMLMSGGSKAIGMAADKLGRNQDAAVASAAESAPAIPPAAPAQEAAPEHPTVQAADQIVRELAEAAGMSTELLLPKKPEAPAAVPVQQPAVGNADISVTPSNSVELETAPAPVQSAIQPAQAQEQFTDQDIVHFAAAREDELLAKRDGGPQVVMSEDGPVEQDLPGAGLSPVEAQELTALEHAAGNSAVLRQLYGFDQQLTREDAAYVPERAQVSEEAATPQTAQGPEAVAPAVNNEIDQAAHEAATSPLNDKPQPTEAQKEAGNYKKGHVILQGLDISIENPEGSTRSGVSEDGKAWESTMQHHYGYIKGTVGADKDHIDTFIGPNHASDRVFVVDQINPKTGKFDEHKVMLGFDSQQEADQAYHDNYDAGWNGRGAITAMSMTNFKEWLDSGNTKKPFVEMAPTIQEIPAVENQPARTKPKTEKEMRQAKTESTAEKQGLTEKEARARKGSGAQAARDRLERENPFMAFLAKNGVNTKDRGDVGAENNARIMVPGYGPIFKRNAPAFDELAMLAKEEGFLMQADIDDQTDNGGTNKLMDMIRRAINNNEIIGRPRAGETNRFASMARAREEAELLAEANNLGIDTDGMTIEQVYDTVQSRHAEQISEPIDVFEKASSIADAIDDLDADIPFELSDPRLKSTNHFSDEEIDGLFGIQKETGNKEAGRAGEGTRSEDARPGIEGTRAPERGRTGPATERGSSESFVLESQTLAEAKAEQEAAESAAKQKAADDRAADEADKKAQFNKEVSALQQASAENFQLGQDANDAIAGQQGIFDAPAASNVSEPEPATKHTIVTHVTAKGKELRGAILRGISKSEAQAIDKYTFPKDGGWFVRAQHLDGAPVDKEIAEPRAPVKTEAEARAERTIKQADKLREAGQKLADAARSDMSRDRLSNTAKRARQAASAEADASKREAIGKTMINIANAIESGEAKLLNNVTTRAAVEELNMRLTDAMFESDRGLSYTEQQSRKGRAPNKADIDNTKLPKTSWESGGASRSKLMDALHGKRGAKALIDRIRYSSAPDAEILTALKKFLSEKEIDYHLGWWNVAVVARLGRLERMGIKSNSDLRAVLTEFVQYRNGAAKADPIKEAERALVGQKVGFDYFPTPKQLALRMAEMAGVKDGMSVLEPSAGNGNLADAAKEAGGKVDTVEISTQLRNVLEAKGYDIVAHDFEEHDFGNKRYDAVIMNPPFSDRKDADHIMRAFGLLNPGGKLVAIAGEGVFFGSDKKAVAFREWLEERGADIEKLPEGTFNDRTLAATTGANSRLIVIEKPEEQLSSPSSGKADKGVALFSRESNTKPRLSISRVDAERTAALFNATFLGAPKAVIVDSFNNLPDDVKREADDQGVENGKGVVHHGVVYLIRDSHRNAADLEETIAHEVIGHIGLEKVLGADSRKELNRLFLALGGLQGLTRISQKRGIGATFAEYVQGIAQARGKNPEIWNAAVAQAILTEEVFAHIAQNRLTFVDRFKALVGKVRAWLRSVGLMTLAEYGETDILHLLDRSRAAMREDGKTPDGQKNKNGAGDPDIRFAVASNSVASSVSTQAADAVVDSITSAFSRKYGRDVPVHLVKVSKFSDLPESVKASATRQNAANHVRGALSRGTLYLVENTHRSATELEETIFHELYGHAATSNLFGNDWKEKQVELLRAIGGSKGVMKIAQENNINLIAHIDGVAADGTMANDMKLAVIMDELLAHIAEKGPSFKQLVKEYIGAIRAWLRDHGFAALAQYNDTDLAHVLRQSRDSFMEQQFGYAEAPAALKVGDNDSSLFRQTERSQKELIAAYGNPNFTNIDWWDKSIGTQFHKAEKNPHFRRVFDLAVQRENAISLTSIRAAELAPSYLPRTDAFKEAIKTIVKGRSKNKQMNLATDAIVAGTLSGNAVLDGRVWTDDGLRETFGMNDEGIMLYRQARAAIDASLDEIAAAEAYAAVQLLIPRNNRENVLDYPQDAERILEAAIDKRYQMERFRLNLARKNKDTNSQNAAARNIENIEAARKTMRDIFDKSGALKKAGYAPLMRFGKYTVTVEEIDPKTGKTIISEDGKPNTMYFGRFETEGEAQAEYFRQSAIYGNQDNVAVRSGTVNDNAHKLYSGISPETLALFAEELNADKVMHKFYQLAVAERSSLKRRLQRNSIAGFSRDMPRVLSNFITSNGRHAAQRYYTRDLNNAVKRIPREKADVQKEAIALKEYLDNPQDGGAMASSVAFTWFLGGNIASAALNATQPVLMTLPYLSQWGAVKAAAALAKAGPQALGKREISNPDLRQALNRAAQEGKVDAQEIFHLYSVGIQGVAAAVSGKLTKIPLLGNKVKGAAEDIRARLTAFGTLWGMPFAMVEGFNRRLTFIAAWNMAQNMGNADPYAFAVKAVDATQGIYSKVSRPNWARSSLGRIVFTFAQFKIMNVELLKRMWSLGGPEGKKAALIYLSVLILASGLNGLPYSDDVDDIIDTLGQLMGYDTNMKRTKRAWAHRTLGKYAGDMLLYGAISKLPFDISSRMGLANIFPATGAAKISNEGNKTQELMELGGPVFSGLGKKAFDAYDAATLGDYGKAASAGLPSALTNAIAGAEMASTGKAKDYKGREKADVSLSDAAFKGLGFNPTAVADKNRVNMPIQQDLALQRIIESSVVEQWAQALASGDTKAADAAKQRMTDWNRKNPETPISITANQLRSKAKTMLTPTDTRMIKGAPKEMRGRVAAGLGD